MRSGNRLSQESQDQVAKGRWATQPSRVPRCIASEFQHAFFKVAMTFSLQNFVSASDDFLSLDLFPIYDSTQLSRAKRLMVQRLPGQLPDPADFSIANPSHIAALALLGHFIFPADKAGVRRSVADSGSFTKLMELRVNDMRQSLRAEAGMLMCMGLNLSEIPEPRKSRKDDFALGIPRGLLPKPLADVLVMLDDQVAYFKEKLEARMNRFAQDYGFGDVGKLLRFVDEVSDVLQSWGFPDYGIVTKPDRFIDQMLSTTPTSGAQRRALEDLRTHRAVLRQRTAGEIWLFVRSRASELEGLTFEIENEVVTVVCKEGQTLHRTQLVDRYMDGMDMLSDGMTV